MLPRPWSQPTTTPMPFVRPSRNTKRVLGVMYSGRCRKRNLTQALNSRHQGARQQSSQAQLCKLNPLEQAITTPPCPMGTKTTTRQPRWRCTMGLCTFPTAKLIPEYSPLLCTA
jgi:hypothetical protein